ncbi:MAG: hypothetical protein OEZ43_11585 [Gammaproteobacteria bacterium]|nr:hypothetical protein [Gammaproteobacteria bacterium]
MGILKLAPDNEAKESWVVSCIRRILPVFLVNDGLDLSPEEIDIRWRDRWSTLRLHALLILLLFLLLVVLFGAVFYLSFLKSYNTTFNINAETELLVLQTYPNTNHAPWVLENANIVYGCDAEDEFTNFNGVLELTPGVAAVFKRISYGDLNISLEFEDGKSVGNLYDNSETLIKTLPACTYIKLKDFQKRANKGQTSLFRLSGKVVLGEELGDSIIAQQPLFKGGEVSFSEKKLGFNEYYSIGPYPLPVGAFVKVQKNTEMSFSDFDSLGQGFVTINADEAMRVVYRETGESVIVQHYKSEPFEISNGIMKRLFSESGQAYLWAIALIVYGLIRILLRISLK